ncbi:hypothetical protein XENOCAPTIV_003743 [Xenoophorus captivus]|uniref:MARVEL domain-containing protein 2 n=1 Tax=Xenoophorus captivus TaxID=1517983 RepID=A0ABV0QZB8_9TELE
MSYGGGFHGRTERVRQAPHYDEVPQELLPHSESYDLHPLREQRAPHLAKSADPLPPPPLPEQPPVGQEFDPSGSEEDAGPEPDPAIDIKPVHRFIPDSWKNFFRGSNRSSKKAWSMPESSSNNNNSTTDGVRCSPPHSPSLPGSYRDPYGGSGGSYNSRKELLDVQDAHGSVSGHTHHTALTYSERVEEYHQRYGYMKSWAGLLRILGCVELLLGAAVFACVCAYIHKDNEWFNMFGYSSPGGTYGGGYNGAGLGGMYYTGPKTPFVLVVAGLAWLVTVILLVLGMTMYYRTILLDSNWWPLTEFVLNLALAVLYMAAGIIYVRDTIRGGLCYYPVFNNGINGAFCRTEAGQTAAIIFLFVTMTTYLIGAIVCLKLWRHEAARRYQERYGQEYPPIRSDEGRDQYRAVFNDQYAEYKELHADVQATVKKFDEMDAMMRSLPQHPTTQTVAQSLAELQSEMKEGQQCGFLHALKLNNNYLQLSGLGPAVSGSDSHTEQGCKFQKEEVGRKMELSLPLTHVSVAPPQDPAFLEKKERCEYLKSKLSHIKQRIQEYDKVMEWNDGYS